MLDQLEVAKFFPISPGKRNKGTKRYMPQKNSVAYALLITLYRWMANSMQSALLRSSKLLFQQWKCHDSRCTTNGEKFMHKQELIDATEASGLSRAPVGYGCRCLTWFSIQFNVLPAIVLSEFWLFRPWCVPCIRPEKGKGKAGQFGSPRDWYSGWSCMGKLIDKGLVAKSSCPAKYACHVFYLCSFSS